MHWKNNAEMRTKMPRVQSDQKIRNNESLAWKNGKCTNGIIAQPQAHRSSHRECGARRFSHMEAAGPLTA